MTITDTLDEPVYMADGVTVAFVIPFTFDDVDDIVVTRTDASGIRTRWQRGVHYDVDVQNGRVDVSAYMPAPAGGTVAIGRETPALQPDHFPDSLKFPARLTERGFDRVVRILQELRQRLRRSFLFPEGEDPPGGVLPPVAQRAGRLLSFDEFGRPETPFTAGSVGGGGGAYVLASGAFTLDPDRPRIVVTGQASRLDLPPVPADGTVFEFLTGTEVTTDNPVPLVPGAAETVGGLASWPVDAPLAYLVLRYRKATLNWEPALLQDYMVDDSGVPLQSLINDLVDLTARVDALENVTPPEPPAADPVVIGLTLDSVVINGVLEQNPTMPFEDGVVIDESTFSWNGSPDTGRSIAGGSIDIGSGPVSKTGLGPYTHTFTENISTQTTVTATVEDDQGNVGTDTLVIRTAYGLFWWEEADTAFPANGAVRSANGTGVPNRLDNDFGFTITLQGSGTRQLKLAYPTAMGDVAIRVLGFTAVYTLASSEVEERTDTDGGGAGTITYRVLNITVDDGLTEVEVLNV